MTTKEQIEALKQRLEEIAVDEAELKKEKKIVKKTIANLEELLEFDEDTENEVLPDTYGISE